MDFKNDPRCSALPPLEPISVNDGSAPVYVSRRLPVCGCWVGSHDYLVCETCGEPVCRKHAATFAAGYPLECPICYEESLEGRCQDLLHQAEGLHDALNGMCEAFGDLRQGYTVEQQTALTMAHQALIKVKRLRENQKN